MKFVPRMLSISWISILKWVGIFPYAQHARKLVTCWVSMRKNRLLVGWACAEIGYLLAVLAQTLIICWLSMRENWLLVGWSCAKIGFSLGRPLSHGSAPCLPSSPWPCPHGSPPCPSSSVHCLLSPFCGSIPLFVSFAPLFPVLCSSISCPLSFVL